MLSLRLLSEYLVLPTFRKAFFLHPKAYPAKEGHETAISETAQTDKHRLQLNYIIPTESHRRISQKNRVIDCLELGDSQ
jgi:hypothetical protein